MFGTCRFKPFIASLNLSTNSLPTGFLLGRPTQARVGGKAEELVQARRLCRLLAGPQIKVTELLGPRVLVSENLPCAMKVREVHALGQSVALGARRTLVCDGFRYLDREAHRPAHERRQQPSQESLLHFEPPFGVARSSTPRPSLSVALNSTCPRSLLAAPELGTKTVGGGNTGTSSPDGPPCPRPGSGCPSGPPDGASRATRRTTRCRGRRPCWRRCPEPH